VLVENGVLWLPGVAVAIGMVISDSFNDMCHYAHGYLSNTMLAKTLATHQKSLISTCIFL
jgi:hypothetical protein